MGWRHFLCATLAVLLVANPVAAQSQEKWIIIEKKKTPAPTDVSGVWRDARGDRITITQNGSSLTMAAPSGRTFTGFITGNELHLKAPFHGSEVADAPASVQDQVEARHAKITFDGTFDAKTNTINATETKPDDVRWNGANQITAFAIKYGTRIALTKPDKLHIGKLNPFGYENALHAEKTALTQKIQDAQDTQDLVAKRIVDLDKRWEADSDAEFNAVTANAAVLAQVKPLMAKLQALLNAPQVIPPAARALNNQKIALQKSIDKQLAVLMEGTAGNKATMDALRASYAGNLDALDAIEQKLQPLLPKPPDTTAQQRALQAQLDTLDAQALANDKLAAHASSAQDTDDTLLRQALDDHAKQETIITDALRQMNDLDGSLVEVQVLANGVLVYDAKGQGTEAEVKVLDAKLAQALANMQKFDQERQEFGAIFRDAQRDALASGEQLQRTIMNTAWARAGVDFTFNLIDVAEAFSKGGVAGALTETGKKVVEALVFNAVDGALSDGGSVTDTSVLFAPFDLVNGLRGKKAAVVDTHGTIDTAAIEARAAANVTAHKLDEHGWRTALFDSVSGKAAVKTGVQRIAKELASNFGKAELNKRVTALAYGKLVYEPVKSVMEKTATGWQKILGYQLKQIESLEKMKNNLDYLRKGIPTWKAYREQQGFITGMVFPKAGDKLNGTKLKESIGKDVIKYAMKAEIDAVERQQYYDYFTKGVIATAAYAPYALANHHYWLAKDGYVDEGGPTVSQDDPNAKGYDQMRKERDQLLQDYDPMSGFKSSLNVEFDNDAMVEVRLIINGSPKPQVGVTTGGAAMTKAVGWSYQVSAKDMKPDATKAVDVNVHPDSH